MKILLLILLLSVFSSCKDKFAASDHEVMKDSYSLANVEAEIVVPEEAAQTPIMRKLVKNGSLIFETSDVNKTRSEIKKICSQHQGYVGSENQNNFDNRLQNNQEIRVPATHFDKLMEALEGLASTVEQKNINVEDVTEEFIDIEARLKTKRNLEQRYRELLSRAKNVTEILAIESQIGTIRSDIESMEGRMNFLKNQVSLSTIKISYYEVIGGDFGFASKLVYSFKNGWENLLTFLIGVIQVWPFLILMVLVGWFFARWKKKKAMVA
jgi:hypothetical protein